MPNFNPKTEQLNNFAPVGEAHGTLSRTQIQVRLEQNVHDALMALPKEQRITLLRKWVREGVQSLQAQETAGNSLEEQNSDEANPAITKKPTKSKSKKPRSHTGNLHTDRIC